MIRKTHGIDLDLPLANRLLAITAEKVVLQNIPTRAMKYLPLKLKHFLARSYGAYPTLEKSARELGVSSRTLRRKLAEEGTSYKQEVDKVKERFAREYFARGGRSIAELASLLGFANSPAFTRAFKRWTSLTPSEFILKTTGINIELVD
jgi:AraC-like DNA-binding protein